MDAAFRTWQPEQWFDSGFLVRVPQRELTFFAIPELRRTLADKQALALLT